MTSSAVDRFIRLTIAVSALALVLAAGCDEQATDSEDRSDPAQNEQAQQGEEDQRSNADDDKPRIVYEDGPEPSADAPLAEAGEVEVTLADFERAIRRSTLVAPDGQLEPSKERLASPNLQINVVKNLLTSAIIARQAERLELEASRDEKIAALESKERLAEFAPLLEQREADEVDRSELEKRGLTVDDLDALATDLVLREKLRDALAAQVTDEQLWQAYRQQNDRIRLLLASLRNTPTSDEISAFVEQQPDRIEQHFEANKKQYRSPTQVQMVILSPAPGEDVDPAVLEEAATRLEGGDPDEIAADLGLRSDDDALLVRGENTEAFDAEPGTTGFQTSGARGAYAWKVRGKKASTAAKLTRSLQREIAAQLLREQTVVDSKGERIEEALSLMEQLDLPDDDEAAKKKVDALQKRLEDRGLTVEQTPMFPRNGRGFIPGVGLAEQVVETAFAMGSDDPVADEPIMSRGKVWAVRVLDRQSKGRERFEADKEAFRQEYTERMRERLLDQSVGRYQDEHDARLDLEPLRIKYGELQKD